MIAWRCNALLLLRNYSDRNLFLFFFPFWVGFGCFLNLVFLLRTSLKMLVSTLLYLISSMGWMCFFLQCRQHYNFSEHWVIPWASPSQWHLNHFSFFLSAFPQMFYFPCLDLFFTLFPFSFGKVKLVQWRNFTMVVQIPDLLFFSFTIRNKLYKRKEERCFKENWRTKTKDADGNRKKQVKKMEHRPNNANR